MELDQRLAMGWYRTHQILFTTSHLLKDECRRVHWLRIRLAELTEHPSHRRVRNRNKSFVVTVEDFQNIRPDHEELYSRYRASIDFDGALTIQEALFGGADAHKNIFKTKCISVFDCGKLIAGGYFDVGERAAAAILHFSDPAYKRHSLGKYLMLISIDFLRLNGFAFYYPGYLISGHPKMNYKLFIGREATQYFDPESKTWKDFQDGILSKEEYTEREILEVLLALLNGGA